MPGKPDASLRAQTGNDGDVAQLGERGLCKPEVDGSIPFISTNGDRAKDQERKQFYRSAPKRALHTIFDS